MKLPLRVVDNKGDVIHTREMEVSDGIGKMLFGPNGPGPDDVITMTLIDPDDAA